MTKRNKFLLAVLALALALPLLMSCGATKSEVAYDEAPMAAEAPREEVAEDAEMNAELPLPEEPAEGGGTERSEKIVYTYNIDIEMLDTEGVKDRVEKLVADHGGYIQSASASGLNERDNSGQRPSYNYTLRIPAKNVKAFLDEIATIGDVKYLEQYQSNMTTVYYDTEARLETKRAEEKRLQELLKQAENVEDIIAIEGRLSEVRFDIEQMEGDLRQIDRDVDDSTVYLNIREVEEFTATFNKNAPLGDRVNRYLEISYETLRDGGEFLLYFLIVWGPWLILVILIIVIIVIANRNKRAKRREQYMNDQRQIAAWYGQNGMPGQPAPQPPHGKAPPKPLPVAPDKLDNGGRYITVEDKGHEPEKNNKKK